MKVLNSSKAFREHYSTRAGGVFDVAKATVGGGAVASSVVGTAATAAGTAAAHASLWSLGANLPLIGAFAAGKATAVGMAAGTAVLGSAAVLLPAAILGGGVAYGIYSHRAKKTLHKCSGVENLADAFAHVACLPMLALAVAICHANPANEASVRDYVVKELGAWGYAEPYVQDGFAEALRHSPQEIAGQYDWAIKQLASGSTEGIGATPVELPVDVVRGFADEFCANFKLNVG